jgi:hypothetical protein
LLLLKLQVEKLQHEPQLLTLSYYEDWNAAKQSLQNSSNISPLPPLPPLPKIESYTDQIISHPKAIASWSMIPQPRGRTLTSALPIRSDCTLKIP